jgi:hypothetical protein
LKINEEEDPIECSQITAIPTMQDIIVDMSHYDDNDLPKPPTNVEQSQSLREFMEVEEEIERVSAMKDRTMLHESYLQEEDPLL